MEETKNMDIPNVECCECGKTIKMKMRTENIFIPQFRCDSCLKKRR